ncbi:MAG: hypothetical protein KJ065_19905, partial [Anaerolineae bacterium]|nr:hypothetical protein [Anaerolineae bacterium]
MISTSFAQAPQCVDVCYVNAETGNDANSGAAPDQAKRTIQAAVNALQPDGEIFIAVGEYTEQLSIEKNLSLRGEDANGVILRAPQSLVNSPPVPPGASSVRSLITIRSGATATMTGITVSGPLAAQSCNDNVSGIYVHQNAQLNLSDAIIRDTYPSTTGTDLSTCATGVSVRVGEYGEGTPATATINTVTFTGFQKAAVVISNEGSQATIEDSTIVGAGNTPALPQNGIQISAGANALVHDNVIRDLRCDNATCGSDPASQ